MSGVCGTIGGMEKVAVTIKGMTCGHCVMSVTEELEAAGATEVAIDLVKGGLSTAQIGSDQPLTDAAITDAVAEAGYEVESINR